MSNPWAACGGPCSPVESPVYAFVVVKVSCPYFDILNLAFLMQVVLSALVSCLLPLQLGFKHFQAKFSLLRSK